MFFPPPFNTPVNFRSKLQRRIRYYRNFQFQPKTQPAFKVCMFSKNMKETEVSLCLASITYPQTWGLSDYVSSIRGLMFFCRSEGKVHAAVVKSKHPFLRRCQDVAHRGQLCLQKCDADNKLKKAANSQFMSVLSRLPSRPNV